MFFPTFFLLPSLPFFPLMLLFLLFVSPVATINWNCATAYLNFFSYHFKMLACGWNFKTVTMSQVMRDKKFKLKRWNFILFLLSLKFKFEMKGKCSLNCFGFNYFSSIKFVFVMAKVETFGFDFDLLSIECRKFILFSWELF